MKRKKNYKAKLGLAALTLMGTSALSFADEQGQSATQLSEVVVTGQHARMTSKGYTAREITLPKYSQPLLHTPQSISVVTKELMKDQHVTSMRDAVRNVSGISIAAGEGGAQGDSLTLRGFTARNDIFLDGMRDFGSYYRDAFNWESVEVLKGPASVAFGRGSTGGVVNQVSKAPKKQTASSVEFSVSDVGRQRVVVDTNVSDKENKIAMRLNAMEESGSVANRDVVEGNRWGIAPSITYGVGTDTRVTLSHMHQQDSSIPDYGIPWLFNAPAPVDPSTYYGFESDFLRTRADVSTLKIEQDFGSTTIQNQVRYGNYTRQFRGTEAKIAGSPTLTTPISAIQITRNILDRDSTETLLQDQLSLSTKFDFGQVSHDLNIGIEASRETSDPVQKSYTGVPGDSLVAPNNNQSFSGTFTTTTTRVASDSFGLYGIDTIALNSQWDVIAGLRWDQIKTSFSQTYASKTTRLEGSDSMLSYRGALVYKPAEEGSIYLGYGTSFNPSAETLSLSTGNASLSPEENATIELGTKWELFKKKVLLRTSLFRTDKKNARETNPGNSSQIVLAGQQRVTGLELEISGKFTDAWAVNFSSTYMTSEVLSSQYFPSSVGKRLANVPDMTLSLWSTYALDKQWEIGGGTTYVGARTSSSTAPFDATTGLIREVPSYWTFSAMASHKWNDRVETQLNIGNLFNTTYYDQVHNAHIVPGEGRTFTLSTSVKF